MSTGGGALLTTLEDIVAGSFPTAYDRTGAGGVLVTVKGLTVIAVESEPETSSRTATKSTSTQGPIGLTIKVGYTEDRIPHVTPRRLRCGSPRTGSQWRRRTPRSTSLT